MEEAIVLAKRYDVLIPDDIDFYGAEAGSLGKDINASYWAWPRSEAWAKVRWVSWKDFYNVHGKIMIQLDSSILKSDEGIVGFIAHEMHELNKLRKLFEETPGQRMTVERLAKLINAEHDGQLHLEAWDVSDQIITRMRNEGKP
ncbi:hypothetical protein [Verrucomicrobium spinosum]|uniref:hypothetical protein n=1 Tax=Verrucomicrobium spinosum TaxID=2736 RepID=UPI000174471E|nr:hypothetical protein [Verrucomicrobium spinosum]